MEEEIGKLRNIISNKDNETVESVRQAIDSLQKASMKLFEFAYKDKVSLWIVIN